MPSSVGAENRVDQIIAGGGFADIDASKRRPPAAGHRERQHLVGFDHAVGDAVHAVRHRHAGGDRLGEHFAERQRAIARQIGEPLVAQIDAEPVADLAAGAQHFEFRGRSARKQQQMIAEPAEAAKHDVFILRQRLAGLDRAPPHPLDDFLVGKQRRTFDVELAKRRDHDTEH